MRISHFLRPVAYRELRLNLFSIQFGSIYIARTFIPSQKLPSINMASNGTDPNINSAIHIFSHLHIPTKYQYLTGVQLWHPRVVLPYYYGCKLLLPCIHLYTRPTLVYTNWSIKTMHLSWHNNTLVPKFLSNLSIVSWSAQNGLVRHWNELANLLSAISNSSHQARSLHTV